MSAPGRSALGKTTRPSLPGILPRKRLFDLLDEARAGGAVWLAGPPGSGKTTLAASYLDHAGHALSVVPAGRRRRRRRDLLLLPGARRRGAGRVRPGAAAAAHAGVPRRADALRAQLLPGALRAPGRRRSRWCSTASTTSRPRPRCTRSCARRCASCRRAPSWSASAAADPPPALARLRANRALALIDWEALRLTPRGDARDRRPAPSRPVGRGARSALRAHRGLGRGPGADARAVAPRRAPRRGARPCHAPTAVRLPGGGDLPEIRPAHAVLPAAHRVPGADDRGDRASRQRRARRRAASCPSCTATTTSPRCARPGPTRSTSTIRCSASSCSRARPSRCRRMSGGACSGSARSRWRPRARSRTPSRSTPRATNGRRWRASIARARRGHAGAGTRRDAGALGRGPAARGAAGAPLDRVLGGGEPPARRAARGAADVRARLRAVPGRRRSRAPRT